MDATRADVEFTAEVVQIAHRRGRDHDQHPRHRRLRDARTSTRPSWSASTSWCPGCATSCVSVHCHDDLGLAVANSFAGAAGGRAPGGVRDQRHRRARRQRLAGGDRDAAAHPRGRRRACTPASTRREIARTSRLVSRLTGYAVQPNKAIVGRNAFAHESGIHQDGVLKERTTYEIMDATHGRAWTPTRSCWASTPAATRCSRRWRSWASQVDGQALNQAFKRFKEIADKKKQVTAMDLEALVTDELRDDRAAYALEWFDVEASSRRPPHATVGVRHARRRGAASGSFTGDGPVDAIFRAINAATGNDARLREFRVDAVTAGQDALGETSVVLELDGVPASGQGVSTDIIEAAGRAYVRALSNAERKAAAEARGRPRGGAHAHAVTRRAGGATADRPARLAAPRRRGDRRARALLALRDAGLGSSTCWRASGVRATGAPARRGRGGRAPPGIDFELDPRRPGRRRRLRPCGAPPRARGGGRRPQPPRWPPRPRAGGPRRPRRAGGGRGRRAPLVDVGPVGGPAPSHPLRALRGARAWSRCSTGWGPTPASSPATTTRGWCGAGGGRTRCWAPSASSGSAPPRPAGAEPYAELVCEVARRDGRWRAGAPRVLDAAEPLAPMGTAWTWTGGCARRASASACAPPTPARASRAPPPGPAGSPPPGPRPRTRGP